MTTTTMTTLALTPFVDPLPVPPVLRPPNTVHHAPEVTVRMQPARVHLHSELPPSPVWTYNGQLPGPTIEVWRGRRARVRWVNELTGAPPVVSVVGPPGSQNEPGRSGRAPADLSGVPAWGVVHVHGAAVAADSDGWPDNGLLPGRDALYTYDNDQPATALWYHDHVMGLTALNVYSGLAGMYLIRDAEEDDLGLPAGRREIPLMLQDRNLDADGPDTGSPGRLNGRLLHKTEDGANEFFGPFTTVNGRIWPYADLRPRQYRLRLLNASNARTYRLLLVDEGGAVVPGVTWQIGSDGGLFGAPVPAPEGGLVLAPAERADVIVDLRALGGRTLTLVNTASAPFTGAPAALPPGVPDPAHRLPHPEVMQLRVADEGGPGLPANRMPAKLSAAFRRITHDDLPHDHGHRLVTLVRSALPLREMERADPPDDLSPGITRITGSDGQNTGYRTVAGTWADPVGFHVVQDSWEIWRVLNLSGQTHPIHLHLVQFQILRRERYDLSGFDPATGEANPPIAYLATIPVPAEESGWKDTVRVDPGQMAVIAARFAGHSGRYVYHCHLLEHEDRGMMRPFLVMPAGVPAMPHTGHG